jgi:hypothetical protein
MTRPTSLTWLAFLLALTLCGGAQAADPATSGEMTCPAVIENSSLRIDRTGSMPGSGSLGTGMAWLDQGRYAAAYTALEDAVNRGLPDQVERAHAYMQMGLIMCRLDSVETCQRNLEKAFMTNGHFELPVFVRQWPNVQHAYTLARQYFETRCSGVAPRVETKTNMAESARFGNSAVGAGEATLLLNVKPWALVAVDGAAVLTPPTKKIMVKPGRRTISIKHPQYGTIFVEGDFGIGEVWIVRKMY